jgi:hypothetical protein
MAKLTIQAQYYENYNVGPEGFNTYGDGLPHWKPKGGHEFVIPDFDSDFLFYDEEQTVEVLKRLVEAQSTIAEKFEYISHELSFGEPTEIKFNKFMHLFGETNPA